MWGKRVVLVDECAFYHLDLWLCSKFQDVWSLLGWLIDKRRGKQFQPPAAVRDALTRQNKLSTLDTQNMAFLMSRITRLVSHTHPLSPLSTVCIRHSKPFIPQPFRSYSSTPDSSDPPPIDDSMLPQPIDRSYETPDVTRARLLYQSRKRGILETDLLLSTFAHKHLPTMSDSEMREYDKVCQPTWEYLWWDSYWTSRIGRYIIGLRKRNLFLRNGRIVLFWDCWKNMSKTREKWFYECRIWSLRIQIECFHNSSQRIVNYHHRSCPLRTMKE